MVFSGELISLEPAAIKAGLPVNLVATYYVSTSSFWEVINGWSAKIELTLDGLGGKAIASIFGYYRTISHTIILGPDVMPNYDLNGYAKIICYKSWPSTYAEVVYYKPITIKVLGGENGGNGGNDEVPEEPKSEFPLIPFAIGAGLIVVTAALLPKKKSRR